MLNTIMTADSLFLTKAPILSIYLLLKPLSSKLLTLPSSDKKQFVNSLKIERKCTLSYYSCFSQLIAARLVPIFGSFFPTLSILTILLDKCQTKICFEDMNILIKAILKFCTINQFCRFVRFCTFNENVSVFCPHV